MSARLRTLIMTAGVVTCLAGGTATAQKVSYDFDKTADFSKIRTYAFKTGTASGNPLVDQRITQAIAATLAARGMAQDESRPDVYVVTHLTFDKEKDLTTYSTGPYGGYGWFWGGGWGTTDVRVRNILMGTLVIDMVDTRKGAVIWRGIGVKEVKQQRKPESVDKNVNEAVAKILKNFPPNASS